MEKKELVKLFQRADLSTPRHNVKTTVWIPRKDIKERKEIDNKQYNAIHCKTIKVELPYVTEPLTLSVGDKFKVILPIESTDDIDGENSNSNGIVKWLGLLPTVSEKQRFAGIETDTIISSTVCNGTYNGHTYFTCPEGHGIFLPVEYVVRHLKDIRETITPAYHMNVRPHHGIALVISLEINDIDSDRFKETFEHLNYLVQCHNVTNILEMMNLVETIDHTDYDSFVCCISSGGVNYCTREIKEADIYKLVNKVQQCSSLDGKPKLIFIQCSRVNSSYSSHDIGPDTFIAWSSQKGKLSLCHDTEGGSQFVIALKRVFKHYASSTDLMVMMEKVSAIVSMNLSTQTDTVGQCCAVESKLKNKVYFFHELPDFDYSMLLDQALEDGYVTVKWTKVVLSGPPTTGKPSVVNLLLEDSSDSSLSNTRQIEITSLISAGESSNQPRGWLKVDYKSLKTMVAQAMKEGFKSRSATLSAIEGQSSDEIPRQCNKPPIKAMPPSPSIKEITQLLPAVKKSNELYQAHWIYVVNSGGQAAFLDVAPVLLHYNLINIIPLKLNKKLKEDKPEFYFDVKGELIPEPKERQMTHLQLIESSFRSLASRDLPDLPCNGHIKYSPCCNKKPCLLVLGIDKIDESNESLDKKDAILWSTLKHFNEVRLDYRESREKVIFPINAIAGDDEVRMANIIRNRICKFYIEAEIPARWFLFQLDLDQLHKTSETTIISKYECLEIGAVLKMDTHDVEAALKYYHDLTIFLYFHEVLPNVVFLHPQPLFDKLSELISISFADAVDYLEDKCDIILPPGAHTKMKTEGTFKRELLNLLSNGFSSSFTADDFLKLMEHVFILAQTNNDRDEYFFPIALPFIADKESVRTPCKMYTDPLVLTWDKRPLPPGLFFALVINLLHRQHFPQFKLDPIESPKGFFQYRNAIQLKCISLGGRVLLVDATCWLEICYSDNPIECPVIRSAIEEEIDKITKKFHCKQIESHPQKNFLCTIQGHLADHLCCPSKDNKRLTCSISTFSDDIDQKRQLPWLHSLINNPNQDISHVLTREPNIDDLLNLLVEIDYSWARIGIALCVDHNFIEGLRKEKEDNIIKLNQVLHKWIESQSSPVTWMNIITKVEGAIVGNFRKIAENIREHLRSV